MRTTTWVPVQQIIPKTELAFPSAAWAIATIFATSETIASVLTSTRKAAVFSRIRTASEKETQLLFKMKVLKVGRSGLNLIGGIAISIIARATLR